MSDLDAQLQGLRLTTAQIFYHLPDHPSLLQEYLWQEYDHAPKFPVLTQFLNFWIDEIEGQLHSVYVARQRLITPGKVECIDFDITIQ